MASLDQNRFQHELSRWLESHPTRVERLGARSALMWLSAVHHPSRAYELLYALEIDAGKRDPDYVERLLIHAKPPPDQTAESFLRDFLGHLISLSCNETGDARKIYVRLSDEGLSVFLHRLYDAPDASQEPMAALAFSAAQAHSFVADVLMMVCSVTTLQFAHINKQASRSTTLSLTVYAWAYWHEHLAASGISLTDDDDNDDDDDDVTFSTDSMVSGVCADVLAFLLRLNDFFAGPFNFPAAMSTIEVVAAITRAQGILERAITLLSAIVEYKGGHARVLQRARRMFDLVRDGNPDDGELLIANMHADESAPPPPPPPPLLSRAQTVALFPNAKPVSTVESLSAGGELLSAATGLFAKSAAAEGQMLRGFAETARSLRVLCMLVAQPAIYGQLARQEAEGSSPLDILVNAADWMEVMAGYAFWTECPPSPSRNPFVVTDTDDPSYETASRVLGRVRNIRFAGPVTHREHAESPRSSSASCTPHGTSRLRWYAATVVGNGVYRGTLCVDGPNNNTSGYPWASIPSPLHNLLHHRVAPVLRRLGGCEPLPGSDALVAVIFTAGKPEAWPTIKATFLSNGYHVAFVYIIAAVLANHIRRTLIPWLGGFVWYAPLEDLRLALSNPEVFLDEVLAVSWILLIANYLQKRAVDMAASTIVMMLAHPEQLDPASYPAAGRLRQRLRLCAAEGLKVVYVTWVLVVLEYAFCRAVYATALITAPLRLLVLHHHHHHRGPGSDMYYVALSRVLHAHARKGFPVAWQTYNTVRYGVFMVSHATLSTLLGNPLLLVVLLGVAGGVVAILRYRSRLFVALQVAGFFTATGFLLVGAALLVVDFLRDPLGLHVGMAAARRLGDRARRVLPESATARLRAMVAG